MLTARKVLIVFENDPASGSSLTWDRNVALSEPNRGFCIRVPREYSLFPEAYTYPAYIRICKHMLSRIFGGFITREFQYSLILCNTWQLGLKTHSQTSLAAMLSATLLPVFWSSVPPKKLSCCGQYALSSELCRVDRCIFASAPGQPALDERMPL